MKEQYIKIPHSSLRIHITSINMSLNAVLLFPVHACSSISQQDGLSFFKIFSAQLQERVVFGFRFSSHGVSQDKNIYVSVQFK